MKQNKAKEKPNKSDKPEKAEEVAQAFLDKGSLETDPLGSWTGTPADPGETPTQDVDDL